jgi:23S rRNA (uracil1939-C5)-methyltransferase
MLRDPRWPRFVRSVEVFTDETGVQVNVLESDRPVARRFFDWCAERMGGMMPEALDYRGRFRVGRHSFFQVNRFLADRLVETALGETRGGSALDLYAGVGLFSLPLAVRFAEVTAVESVAAAAADLRFNAERALAGNLRVERRTAEAYLATLTQAPDFVLLDPPRAGMGAPVVRRLSELRPREIAIVACDPATLARDLAGLLAAGYRIDRMAMVDLFPQTFHLETVVRLVPTTAS